MSIGETILPSSSSTVHVVERLGLHQLQHGRRREVTQHDRRLVHQGVPHDHVEAPPEPPVGVGLVARVQDARVVHRLAADHLGRQEGHRRQDVLPAHDVPGPREDDPRREVGHELADEPPRERDVPGDAVVLVRPVRRPIGRGVVLEGVDLRLAGVLFLHDAAEPVEDLLARLLPRHDVVEVRRLGGADLEVPDVIVDARAVRDELAGQVQVRVPQEVERHHVRVEAHRAHFAAVQRVLVLSPLDHLLHASPDHRVRTGPEDLPLPLLVDVHLGDRVLLALLVDRHLEVL